MARKMLMGQSVSYLMLAKYALKHKEMSAKSGSGSDRRIGKLTHKPSLSVTETLLLTDRMLGAFCA